MATIDERSRAGGRIAYRVMFRIDGRQRSETFDRLEDAEDFVALVDKVGGAGAVAVRDARSRRGTKDHTLTVTEWLTRHVDSLSGITTGTRRTYRALVRRHVEPTFLGPLPLEAVTAEHVQAWVDELLAEPRPLSAKSVSNVQGLLSHALSRAVEKGIRADNPARAVTITRTERREMTVLTEGEFAVLLSVLDDKWQPLVLTLAGTGLRFGEATALRVGDLDLDARIPTLRVSRAWKFTASKSERSVGPPKTGAGSRTVSLSSQVVNAVRPLTVGRAHDAWLFTDGGEPVAHDPFYRAWRKALDRAADPERYGVPWLAPTVTKRARIHDLRHCHAAWLLAAGVPVTTVMRRLGHTDISMTVGVYGRFAPDDLAVGARAAELALAQAAPELEG